LHNFIQQAEKQPVKIKWVSWCKGVHDGYFNNIGWSVFRGNAAL